MHHQHSREDFRNIMLAVVLSTAVLFGWQWFFPPEIPTERTLTGKVADPAEVSHTPTVTVTTPEATIETPLSVAEAVQASPHVRVQHPLLHGAINLRGLRIDHLTLANYHETVDPTSPEVVLLAPTQTEKAYFAEFGWAASGTGATALPGPDTLWQADSTVLTPDQPVTFRWTSPENVTFSVTFTLDHDYLFTITREVANASESPVSFAPYALVSRHWQPDQNNMVILHEGPVGVFNSELFEADYDDVTEKAETYTSTGGWLGISDKYWVTALIPDQDEPFTARFQGAERQGETRYQVDYLLTPRTVAAGSRQTETSRFYAGPKKLKLLDHYGETFNVPLLDRAVDLGVLYFLTKPIFIALQFFYALVGNFGIAILILTVVIKLLLFPLANKSYLAMGRMKELHPKMMEIREQYKEDKIRMQQELMELYKREKINPASGCLPLLIQIPIFFALYKVLYVTIEMRHAPFFGWIQDLSAPDPTNAFTLFGLLEWDPPSLLHVGVWPLIMMITMILQQRMQPTPSDPAQEKVIKAMPYLFLFLFASFPAGLVIYWAWNNTLSILQQAMIMKLHGRHPAPERKKQASDS